MMNNSVDDEYKNCTQNISQLVETKYLSKELEASKRLKKKKEKGEEACKNTTHLEDDFVQNHCVAIYVYTSDSETDPVFKRFNNAARTGRTSYEDRTYEWYSLQFYLTEAVQILNKKNKWSAKQLFVVQTKPLIKMLSTEIRLGSFASSSLKRDVAQAFGAVSCFQINTCYSALLEKFSEFRGEGEVLIPPYETFVVTDVLNKTAIPDLWCETVNVLNSTGTWSNLNCAMASGESLWYHKYQCVWMACVCVSTFIPSFY